MKDQDYEYGEEIPSHTNDGDEENISILERIRPKKELSEEEHHSEFK